VNNCNVNCRLNADHGALRPDVRVCERQDDILSGRGFYFGATIFFHIGTCHCSVILTRPEDRLNTTKACNGKVNGIR